MSAPEKPRIVWGLWAGGGRGRTGTVSPICRLVKEGGQNPVNRMPFGRFSSHSANYGLHNGLVDLVPVSNGIWPDPLLLLLSVLINDSTDDNNTGFRPASVM